MIGIIVEAHRVPAKNRDTVEKNGFRKLHLPTIIPLNSNRKVAVR